MEKVPGSDDNVVHEDEGEDGVRQHQAQDHESKHCTEMYKVRGRTLLS
jgi:hypothetical protein